MRCNKVKKILGAYLDGELSERKARQVQQHLAKCSACSWELKSFQKIDELGRWMADPSQLHESYWEGYLANLHERLEREEVYQQPKRKNSNQATSGNMSCIPKEEMNRSIS